MYYKFLEARTIFFSLKILKLVKLKSLSIYFALYFFKVLFTIVHHGNLKLEFQHRKRSNGISWNWLHVRLTDFDYPSISWVLIFDFVVFKFPFLSHKIYVCSGKDSEWKTHLMNRNDAVSKHLSSTHNANERGGM